MVGGIGVLGEAVRGDARLVEAVMVGDGRREASGRCSDAL